MKSKRKKSHPQKTSLNDGLVVPAEQKAEGVELTILESGKLPKTILIAGPETGGENDAPYVRPEDQKGIGPIVVGEVTNGEMDYMAKLAHAIASGEL